jgi:hypothetical protein
MFFTFLYFIFVTIPAIYAWGVAALVLIIWSSFISRSKDKIFVFRQQEKWCKLITGRKYHTLPVNEKEILIGSSELSVVLFTNALMMGFCWPVLLPLTIYKVRCDQLNNNS